MTKIKNIDPSKIQILKGWDGIINEMIDKIYAYCSLNNISQPHFVQIKQKMGVLRVYIDTTAIAQIHCVEIYKIISEYEKLSMQVCEVTGKFGCVRNIEGWICVLSDTVFNNILQIKHNTGLPIWVILRDEYNI